MGQVVISRYLQYKVCHSLGQKYKPGVIPVQEINYIINYISSHYGVDDHQAILERLLELADRYGVRELNKLYLAIKLNQMKESGRYGTALRTPMKYGYDSGHRVC